MWNDTLFLAEQATNYRGFINSFYYFQLSVPPVSVESSTVSSFVVCSCFFLKKNIPCGGIIQISKGRSPQFLIEQFTILGEMMHTADPEFNSRGDPRARSDPQLKE